MKSTHLNRANSRHPHKNISSHGVDDSRRLAREISLGGRPDKTQHSGGGPTKDEIDHIMKYGKLDRLEVNVFQKYSLFFPRHKILHAALFK